MNELAIIAVLAVIVVFIGYYVVTHHITLASLKTDLEALKGTSATPAPTQATGPVAAPPAAPQPPVLTGDHLVQVVQALAPSPPQTVFVWDNTGKTLDQWQAFQMAHPYPAKIVGPNGYPVDVRGNEIAPTDPSSADSPYNRPPYPSYTAFDFTASGQSKTLPAGLIPAGKYQLVCQNLVSGTFTIAIPNVGSFSMGSEVVLPADVTQSVVCTSQGDNAHGQGTLNFKPV